MTRKRLAAHATVLLAFLSLSTPGPAGSEIRSERDAAGRADEAAAVKAIEKLGGSVGVDESRAGKPVVTVGLGRSAVADAALAHVAKLGTLRSLYLDESKVTDAGLDRVKGLKQLEDLGLDDTNVTDAGLKALKEL